MIKIQIVGGLGNQLFQYATAKCLALKLNTTLCLNLDFYAKSGHRVPRTFELLHFPKCMEGVFIEDHTVPSKLKEPPEIAFTEKYFSFDPRVKDLPDNSALAGYFQSYKYFDEIKETLRDYFLVPLRGEKNIAVSSQMQSVDSVALHIRRGDYVHNKDVAAVHVSQTIDYYKKAFGLLENQLTNPLVYVFSDEIAWAKENIKLGVPTAFIEHNSAADSYLDLVLMAHAKHFIISNSTFSWWAAYLSHSEGGVKIAPKKWFHDTSKKVHDLMPTDWIQK